MFFSPEDLQGVDLDSVAMTAVVNADGTLGPVGGLWQKLEPHTIDLARRGLLRFVVVAEEQHDVHPQYLREDPKLPLVLKAKTVQDAIGQLNAHLLPRRAILHHEYAQCQHLDILGRPVPIATHYHQLPLLRAVKRERLLRRPSTNHSTPENHTQEAEAHGSLRTLDLARWEELLREECITYEPVSAEQLFSAFSSVVKEAKSAVPRWVVLGPPGSGKSTFMQYLAWRAATGDGRLFARSFIPARVRLREWEAWSVKPAAPEASLPSYLAEQYKDLTHAPTAAQWRQWLQRGEVLLLLDGLDEIESKAPFLHALGTALLIFKECPTVITCRTVIFEDHRALCPDFPVFTLSGLEVAQQELCIRVFPAEYTEHYDPEAVIGQLRRFPQMRALTANALLLNIVCFVVDDYGEVSLPTTRGAFYDKAIEKLLTRPRRVRVDYPGEEPSRDEQRAILERLALNLFAQDDNRLTFTGKELQQALKQALHDEGYGEAPALWANALRTDLLQNSGILRGSTEQGLFFLHLTLQEFLAAAALARMVNEQGWERPITIASHKVSIRRFIDAKVWDPHWHEVMLLLAGQLKDPLPLFTLLTDKKQDDLFCCRLALAASCLSEVPSIIRDRHPAMVDRITTEAFSLWFQYEQAGTAAVLPHVTRALPALGQVNGRVQGTPLLQWLCRRLGDAKADVRAAAAEAFKQMGEIAGQYREMLSALVGALHDPDMLVRAEAAEALARMGATAAGHPEVLSALKQVSLQDPDSLVRFGATRALEQIHATTGQPSELLPAFERTGGTTVQSAAIPAHLTVALRDPNEGVRWKAAKVCGQMDATAIQPPELIATLMEVALHDEHKAVRVQATETLGHIGAVMPPSPRLCAVLITALHDQDGGVRAQAAGAFGQIGRSAAPHPGVLSELIAALRDEDGEVRYKAAAALGQMMAQGVRVFRRRWRRVEGKTIEELATIA